MSHKDELLERSKTLQAEIQELNRTFELKKEEFLKVQHAASKAQKCSLLDSQGDQLPTSHGIYSS